MEEKEGRASSDPKGQEDLGGNEADSKDEDSKTDYSSGDEEVLTKAGRLMLSVGNRQEAERAPWLCGSCTVSPQCRMPHLWFSLHLTLSGAYPLQAAAPFLILISMQCPFSYNSPAWGDSGALGPAMYWGSVSILVGPTNVSALC